MDIQIIKNDLQEKMGQQIDVEQEGNNRYVVLTPFMMDDGDHFNIVLHRRGNTDSWIVTDEGDTLMHLSYWMDYSSLTKGTRQSIIHKVVEQNDLDFENGQFSLTVQNDDLGSAIFTFLQALTRITDVNYLAREQVRATFIEDFKAFLRETVPEDRLTFDYHHPQFDRQKIYRVDAVVNHRDEPLYVFAIPNDARCRDVTINLHTYNTWNIAYQSVAIFEDQTSISRPVLARFSDVADKQFSSLVSSNTQIRTYLEKQLR